ncbi:MAG: GGDEF domain-containing protein, partial [Methylophaga sp.]|nr:GGDEF domain-containing protein [Methylophaga sp.]
GGEEFVIIMPETSLYDSQQICETLLEDFRQFRINPALEIPAALNLSFSAGLTVIKYSDTDTSDIINRADHAMYQAKSAGKGQVFLNEVA